jgi:hypothetical protein
LRRPDFSNSTGTVMPTLETLKASAARTAGRLERMQALVAPRCPEPGRHGAAGVPGRGEYMKEKAEA